MPDLFSDMDQIPQKFISESGVILRARKKLAKDGLMLEIRRRSYLRSATHRYQVQRWGQTVRTYPDLPEMIAALKLLKPWETVRD